VDFDGNTSFCYFSLILSLFDHAQSMYRNVRFSKQKAKKDTKLGGSKRDNL